MIRYSQYLTMFYSSNQQKQRQYLKSRRLEEENSDIQQDALDQQLAAERGFEARASNLTRLARRVASNIGEESNPLQKPKAGLKAVNFSDMIQKIIGLDPLTLSRKARIVWKDLNSADFRNNFNEFMLEEADKVKNKGVSQTDMMSELLNIARNALYGGDERIERELEEKASTYAGSEAGNSNRDQGSFGTTVDETIAEIASKFPEAFDKVETNRLASILVHYNKTEPTYIPLKRTTKRSDGVYKNLNTKNPYLVIEKNNMYFQTKHSTGGYKNIKPPNLEELNKKEFDNALTELSAQLSS